MTFLLDRPQNHADALLRVLTEPDVWASQAFDAVQHPEAFPANEGDWAFLMADDQHRILAYVCFVAKGQGVYEQHTGIPEQHRHLWDQFIAAAHRAMFLQTDATMLITCCPDWLPHLVKVAGRFGGKKMWRNDHLGTRDGTRYGAQMMGLTVMDWAWRVHLEFAQAGHEWHEAAFAGGAEPHEDDQAHDGFVGLALAMSVGFPSKAQQIYNTWALTAGYWPLRVLWYQDGNSLLDIGSSTILNRGGKFAAAIPSCPQQPPS